MVRQLSSPRRRVSPDTSAFLTAVLILWLSACASAPGLLIREVYGVSSDSFQSAVGAQAQAVRPGRNFHGHPGKKSRQFQIIRTQKDWDALWPEGYEAPQVDFSREMVLAAFAGEKEGLGHRLSFGGASASNGTFRVSLTEHVPADGCENLPVSGAKKRIRPSLILTFPVWDSETEILIRRQEEKTCLLPPEMDLVCAVEGSQIPAFRNALPKALPALGQPVRCTASAEPGAWTKVRLEGVPHGSASQAEPCGRGAIRFIPDLPGTYVIAAEGTRGDGFVSFRSAETEAGIQVYDVELEEEEPEGLLGFELELRRLNEEADSEEDSESETSEDGKTSEGEAARHAAASALEKSAAEGEDARADAAPETQEDAEEAEEEEDDDFEEGDVCTAASPKQWCAVFSDGYSRHVIIPAAMGGRVEIRVLKSESRPPPQGRLKVSLAGYPIFDIQLSDDAAFWSGAGSVDCRGGDCSDSYRGLSEAVHSGSSDEAENRRGDSSPGQIGRSSKISRRAATLDLRGARVIPEPSMPAYSKSSDAASGSGGATAHQAR